MSGTFRHRNIPTQSIIWHPRESRDSLNFLKAMTTAQAAPIHWIPAFAGMMVHEKLRRARKAQSAR